LDGVVNGNSSLPTDWQRVPYSDPNCIAFQIGNDTPDLTSLTEPGVSGGANGNLYSGNTFISGLFASGSPNFFQEGIMQTVNGFTVGQKYTIRFRQAVVKVISALDKNGFMGNICRYCIGRYYNSNK